MGGRTDLTPLQIVPLVDAKYIFSHVEWDMKGYLIRVAALEESADPKMIFAEIREVEKEYPIPAAFQAYAEQIQMRLDRTNTNKKVIKIDTDEEKENKSEDTEYYSTML